MFGRIYLIKNDVNDKVYVGKTIRELKQRMREHRSRAKRGYKKPICIVMREIGIEHFYIELVEDNIPIEQLDNKEIEYIHKFNSVANGYNRFTGKGLDLDEKEIVRLYNSGKTLKEIGEIYGVDRDPIKLRLKRNGIEIRDWNDIQRIDIDYDDLKRMYIDEGMSLVKIASHYNTSDVTIQKRLKKYGIPTRPRGHNQFA